MHIITPYNPWAPKKKKTWQEVQWEQQQIAEIEAQVLAEAKSATLPSIAPDNSSPAVGPAPSVGAGGGGQPPAQFFNPRVSLISASAVPSNIGTAPFTVQFANQSSPDAVQFYSWTWNFDDGTSDGTASPIHTFTQTGSYHVSLTGSSPSGVVTQSYFGGAVISSSVPLLTANFTPQQTTGSIPFTVTFTNLTNNGSTGSNAYKWTISGSNTVPISPITTSFLANPTFTFYNTGTYAVKLEATGSWDLRNSLFVSRSVNTTS